MMTPAEHRDGQVEEHRHAGHSRHDQHIGQGYFVQDAEGVPGEGANDHHEHDPHQRSNRHLLDEPRSKEDEPQERERGHDAREPSSAPRLDVDDALANHRAAAHSTKESIQDVSGSLGDALPVGVATGLRELVHQVQGHQGLNKPDGGQDTRIGSNEPEGVEAEGDDGKIKCGQAGRDAVSPALGHKACDARRLQAAEYDHQGDHHNGSQSRRNLLGELGQPPHDSHR